MLTANLQSCAWDDVKRELDHASGCVLLKGFPLAQRKTKDIEDHYEELSTKLGIVSAHGASNKKIWHVSPRPSLDHEPTFSETASEAPLHTDNSWVTSPEKYFGLLTISPASSGGESVLLPVAALLKDFANSDTGRHVTRVLRDNLFPFAMPAVFHSDDDRKHALTSVTTAPIIESPTKFRFRYDVIQTGFTLRPDLATPEKIAAVEIFNDFINQRTLQTPTMKLQRGDLLYANNHAVLHARTEFKDPNRLLLRVRIAEATL